MPEGHTVHRLARTFANVFGGHTVHVTSPQGRFEQGAALLNGAQLVHAQAYGKHLFLGFTPTPNKTNVTHTDEPPPESLRWLRVHLGLYGSWTFAAHPNTPIAHAIGAPRRRIGEREHNLTPTNQSPTTPGPYPNPADKFASASPPHTRSLTSPDQPHVKCSPTNKPAITSTNLAPTPFETTPTPNDSSPRSTGPAAQSEAFS